MHTWVSYLCFADEETELKGAKSKDLKVVLRLWRKAGSSAVLRMPIAVLEPTFESSETIYSTLEKTQIRPVGKVEVPGPVVGTWRSSCQAVPSSPVLLPTPELQEKLQSNFSTAFYKVLARQPLFFN